MALARYWNKPEQTAEVLRGGWMHTGDGGYMDQDGFIHVVDRPKDMVVTGGGNVYSAEVENAITQLPEVSMRAAVGVLNAKWASACARWRCFGPGRSLSAERLVQHCKEQIAGYKYPVNVAFVDSIPLSPAGRMLKYRLGEQHWGDRQRRAN